MVSIVSPGGDWSDLFVDPPTVKDVKPPGVFRIDFPSDKSTLIFTIGDPPSPRPIRNKATYRVYFAPIDLAPPSQIGDPFVAYNVFQQSGVIFSVAAPQNGGNVTHEDPSRAGVDGWFFATAVNLIGIESRPTYPIRNPIVGENDSRIPPAVLNPTVEIEDGGLDPGGRQILTITASAKIPFQSQGVQSVVLVNPSGAAIGTGSNYTHDFFVTFINAAQDTTGHGALGYARVRDGAVISVEILDPGEDYTLVPSVHFDEGDGNGAAGFAILTTTGSIAGVQMYLNDYFMSGELVEGPTITRGTPRPGDTIHGKFNLLADSPPSHVTTLYFVSISQTGTRRSDVGASPSVAFPTGLHL